MTMRMKMWLLLLGLVVSAAAAAGPGSCVARCGEVYTRGQQCTCDFSCLQHNECCQDFESACTKALSCLGRCSETFRRGQPCDCDPQCIGYNTCCRDYQQHCDASESVAHPRTSQHQKASRSGNRKSQRSNKRSNSESEEWYAGAFGHIRPLPASSFGPARPPVSTNQLQHGVRDPPAVGGLPASIPPSLRGPPESPSSGFSPPSYSAPFLGNAAPVGYGTPYGSNQGPSSPVGLFRPRPSTLQDVSQALGIPVVEGQGAGVFADAGLCSDAPINGLTAFGNGTVLIFKGQLFWSIDPVTRSFGHPQRITETLGVPAPIDTIFTRGNCHRNVYIIKGDQYWRLDENLVVEPGFPKPLASEFPGLTGSISAALAVPATRSTLETVFFFNNRDNIQRFTFSPSSTPSCSTKPSLDTQLARQAGVSINGEINIKLSLKGFPSPVTSALSMPSPQRSDRYHHYVFTGPLFFSVHIVDDWPTLTKPDPSSALAPLSILSPDAMAANTASHSINPHHPPNSIRFWLRCP